MSCVGCVGGCMWVCMHFGAAPSVYRVGVVTECVVLHFAGCQAVRRCQYVSVVPQGQAGSDPV